MNCTFKYLNDSDVWTPFGQLVTPVNFGDLIKNEVTTSYAIRLYFSGSTEIIKPALTPGTIVKLDFGTKEYQFVIVDGGKIENKDSVNYCYHSYNIQELLAYTREIFIQSAFFSNGLYTVSEFFERLIALSDSDRTIVIDETGDYQIVLDNWQSPDFQVSSNALLDNLIKFGQNNGVRVKARINSSNELELYFKNLKGSVTISTINGVLVNKDDTYMGVNYASRVMALASNITDSDLKWYPNASPSRGLFCEPDSEALEITPDTAVVRFPFNIKNATKLRALGFGKIKTDSSGAWVKYVGMDYRVFYPDGTRINAEPTKYVVVDDSEYTNTNVYGEMDIVVEEKWKSLDVDSSGGESVHRENTLYFKQEDSKIYNIRQFDGGGDEVQKFNAGQICYVEVYDSGGSYLYTDYIYPTFKWEDNKYIALADLYANTLISYTNGLENKRTAIYSQEDNIVSSNVFSKNVKNYVESMENTEEASVYRFSSIDDLPDVGNLYNDKIISQLVCNAYYDKIEATLYFSDNVVKKSEYVNADVGIDLPAININKAFDRFTNYKTVMWFCENYSIATSKVNTYGSDLYLLKPGYLEVLLSAIKNGRNTTQITFAEAELKFGSQYTSISPKVMVSNNTLLVIYKTINNVAIGYKRDKTLGSAYTDFRFFTIAFAGEDKYQVLNMKFKTGRPSGLDDYPLIDQTEFDSNSLLIASIYDVNYNRDPQEVININYQIEAKTTKKDGTVSKHYWNDSSLISDLYFNEDQYTRYYTFFSVNSSGNETAIFGTDIEVGTVNITYLTSESIAKVDILIDPSLIPGGFSIPAEQNAYIIIKRIHDSTFEEHILLKTKCEISGTNPYYITYYVAFTQ